VQVLHIVSLEGHSAKKKCEKDDSSTPQIGLKALIPFILYNFRRDVGWCATLLIHYLAGLHGFGYSEVSDFNFAFTV